MTVKQGAWGETIVGDFEVGDTVRMTAGGPEMIVTDINDWTITASIGGVTRCALPKASLTLVRKA